MLNYFVPQTQRSSVLKGMSQVESDNLEIVSKKVKNDRKSSQVLAFSFGTIVGKISENYYGLIKLRVATKNDRNFRLNKTFLF